MNMKKIRTLIVDDEPLARKTLRLLLKKDSDILVVGECRNGKEAVDHIINKSPDLVLLDIQMPQMTGFEVIDTVGADKMPATIFVTAYDSYALRAFEKQALDYLLKPFDDARFKRSLQRAKKLLSSISFGEFSQRLSLLLLEKRVLGKKNTEEKYIQRLLVKSRTGDVLLKVPEIDWIAAADYCIEIHLHDAKFLHRESLVALEKKLDPSVFVRIHRSFIVNLDRVKKILPTPYGDHIVVLDKGTKLKLSRAKRHLLEQRI